MPQPAASAVLADIVWLHAQSAKRKYLFLADLEWLVIPPFRLAQFRIFRRSGKAFAYASWARVTPEVRERLQSAGLSSSLLDYWQSMAANASATSWGSDVLGNTDTPRPIQGLRPAGPGRACA